MTRHMPGKVISILLGTPLLAAAFMLHAQEEHHDHPELTRDPSLSLADVVEASIQNQPRWREYAVRQEQADALTAVSDGFIAGQPVLNLDYFDDFVFDDIGEHEYQAGVTFPLWWPGQRKSASALANAMQAETQSWESGLSWSVAGEVRLMLGEISLAEARLTAAEEAVADAGRLLALTEAMERAGDVAQADVMLARGRLLEARAVQVEADAAVVDAYREYSVFTGLTLIPAGGLDEIMAPDAAITLEHPLLAGYAQGLDRARQQTEQQRQASRGNPTVTIGARSQRGDRLTEANTALALSFSIPIGGRRFTTASVAGARRQETDIEVSMLEEQRMLQTQLHEVEHEMLVTMQKLTLAEENAVLTERQWNMALASWELGETTMPNVILALQQHRTAQLQLVTLQLQQKALVSAFNQTLGVMP